MNKILINKNNKALCKADGKIYGIKKEDIKTIEGVTENNGTITIKGNTTSTNVMIYDKKDVQINSGDTKILDYGKGGTYTTYTDVHIVRRGGIITADNLEPQHIEEDTDILGVKGTLRKGTPIELATTEEMQAVLVSANVGKIYKYVGETNETFINGNLYQVMEVE